MGLIKTNYIIEQRKGKYLILFPEIPYWIIVSKYGKYIIELFSKLNTYEEVKNELLQEMSNHIELLQLLENIYNKLKKDSVFSFTEHKRIQKFTGKLDSIGLNITNDCNLRCKYCYASAGEKVNSDYKFTDFNYIEKYLSEAREFISDNCYLQLTGGEPFLNKELVFNVLDLCEKLKYPSITINSNGILLSDMVVQRLTKYKNIKNITISVDGSEDIHDDIRGKGSYLQALNAIDVLKKYKIPITASMTVHNGNLKYLKKFSCYCKENNVTMFVNPMFPIGRCSENNLEPVDIFHLFCQCKKLYINNNDEKLLDGTFLRTIICPLRDLRSKHYCGTGLSSVFMDVDGSVYPCVNTIGLDVFRGGNIQTEKFRTIWLDSNVFNGIRKNIDVDINDDCNKCELKYICAGFCRGMNYQVTNELNSKSIWCNEMKKCIYEGFWTISEYPEIFKDKSDRFIDSV